MVNLATAIIAERPETTVFSSADEVVRYVKAGSAVLATLTDGLAPGLIQESPASDILFVVMKSNVESQRSSEASAGIAEEASQ